MSEQNNSQLKIFTNEKTFSSINSELKNKKKKQPPKINIIHIQKKSKFCCELNNDILIYWKKNKGKT